MLHKKIDELFSSTVQVFGISHDILISGFDDQGKDHDETLVKVLWGVHPSKSKNLIKINVYLSVCAFLSYVR